MATPNPGASTAARTQPDMAPVHQSVLERGAPAPRSAALPLAIAALLILGLAGGAWAFRDRIPMLQQMFGGQTATQTAAAPVTAPAPTTVAASTPAAPAAPVTPPPPPAAPPPVATADTNATAATAGASVADLVGPASGNSAHPSDNPVAAANTANATGAAAANDASSAPAPRASQVDPLRDLPAAQAAQAAAPPAKPRIASVTPPPPVSAPPRPHVPTVAVFAVGDETVAEPAERAIEEALSRQGFHLVDQGMMPRAERLLRGQRANVAGILEQLAQRHGGVVDAVIVVHARPVGEQQITFYGQSDTLKTAQLDISAYAVDGRRKLGAGWSDNVNFTAMSARDKAREAVEPMLDEIEASLREFRPAGRKG